MHSVCRESMYETSISECDPVALTAVHTALVFGVSVNPAQSYNIYDNIFNKKSLPQFLSHNN